MTDPLPRPFPRWLHVWAVVTAAATPVLLAFGQLVTSFGAGMADPLWPTEPWYVVFTAGSGDKERYRQDFGFFVEHTHRMVGYTVGAMVIVLALGALWTEPRRGARWGTVAGLAVLVAGYGLFHRGLIEQRGKMIADVILPAGAIAVSLVGVALLVGVSAWGIVTRVRGSAVRLVAVLALVAIMIQGLLGGFRVQKNDVYGPELAAFHGVFAQVVFGLLVMLAVYTGRPTAASGDPVSAGRLRHWANAFAHLVFLQVVLGAYVRHFPDALSQRLHFLTAFAVTALAVWLIRAVFADSAARSRAGWVAWTLAALLVAQLYLGVEAWLARFGQYAPPDMVKVTAEAGAIRTAHALIGSGVWAASLVLTLRLRRTADAPVTTLGTVGSAWAGPRPHAADRTPEGAAARFRGDAQ
jgi:heme A synthase